MSTITLSRRGFLGAAGALFAGFALGLSPEAEAAAEDFAPNVFVRLFPDGRLEIMCHRSEMGQGVRSSVPAIIADELGADLDRVTVIQGDGDKAYGDQNTDGSTSIRDQYEDLRRFGAVAREMLVAAAAARWGIPTEGLVASLHQVTDPKSGQSLGFGELALAAAALPVPKAAEVRLRPESELRYVGTALPMIDTRAFVDGTAVFGADTRLPGMWTAVIRRPPVLGGQVERFDDAEARKVRGVHDVIELPHWNGPPLPFDPLGGIAVIAEHTWAAMEGRRKLDITWRPGPNATLDSAVYDAERAALVEKSGVKTRHVGQADAELERAAKVVSGVYHVPHLVHAPMEPPAAVASYADGACEIWACTQSPQWVQGEVGRLLGIKAHKVTVHVTFLGGGFGRKSKPDFILEAAWLSKKLGRPIRVQWTREDEVQHAFYHASSTQKLDAGLDSDGKLVAWRHRIGSPSIGSIFLPFIQHLVGMELAQGVHDLPLSADHVSVETIASPAHVRIGWMRSVYNINHAFAVQSFIHEIAVARNKPHPEVLKEVLGPPRILTLKGQGLKGLVNYGKKLEQSPLDVGRWHRVIDRVREISGYDRGAGEGRAFGLAAHYSFESYVAAVVAVSKHAAGGPRIEEVWLVVDCGKVINLDRVRAQLEGATIFGMSLALYGRITMRDGAVVQSNFRDYRLVRIPEAPRAIHIDIHATEGAPIGGVGEPGVPPIAPAIANAWYTLTGERRRNLPFHAPLEA